MSAEYNLIVTENCNLRCSYCYMKHPNIKLKIEDIPEIYKSILFLSKLYNKNDDYKNIVFFGGEPLLNWEFIKEFHNYAKFDKTMRFLIISNGLMLDEEKIQYIKTNNIGFSFSFDGIWNDENRPLASGESSFNEYIKKKEVLKKLVNTSKVMVSPRNIKTMTENFEFFINEYGFMNPDFSIVRDDIWTDEDVEEFKIQLKRLSSKYKEYLKNGIVCSIGFFNLYFLDIIFNTLYGKRDFGCFAGFNGVALYPNKVFYPCGRFATSGKYPLYDIDNKTLYKENIKLFQDHNIINPKKYCNKDCDIYNVCNGGCLYSQFIVNGEERETKPIENVCKILKIIYNEVINITEEMKDDKTFKNVVRTLLTRRSG